MSILQEMQQIRTHHDHHVWLKEGTGQEEEYFQTQFENSEDNKLLSKLLVPLQLFLHDTFVVW